MQPPASEDRPGGRAHDGRSETVPRGTYGVLSPPGRKILDRASRQADKPFFLVTEPESSDNFGSNNNVIGVLNALKRTDDMIAAPAQGGRVWGAVATAVARGQSAQGQASSLPTATGWTVASLKRMARRMR